MYWLISLLANRCHSLPFLVLKSLPCTVWPIFLHSFSRVHYICAPPGQLKPHLVQPAQLRRETPDPLGLNWIKDQSADVPWDRTSSPSYLGTRCMEVFGVRGSEETRGDGRLSFKCGHVLIGSWKCVRHHVHSANETAIKQESTFKYIRVLNFFPPHFKSLKSQLFGLSLRCCAGSQRRKMIEKKNDKLVKV